MDLYAQRKRERDLAQREAAGEDVFSPELTPRARGRIANSVEMLLPKDEADRQYGAGWIKSTYSLAHRKVVYDEGFDGSISGASFIGDAGELLEAIRTGPHELAASCVEAILWAAAQSGAAAAAERRETLASEIQHVLGSERVAMRLVDGRLIDFASEELHEEVVAPALRLLAGREGWSSVETAYRKALDEIGQDPADAVTDAGTALQEALTLAGAGGNSLGRLAKSARKRGILAPHDTALADGLTKIIDWVSADRSETGDTHNADKAHPDDAWLAVHVVGALIVRLASDEGRGST